MKILDLTKTNAKNLQFECLSAFEYNPKILHTKINARKQSSFLYIIEGKYKYSFSGRQFVAGAGCVVYLPKGSSYRYDIKSSRAKCMQFEFDSFYDNDNAVFGEFPTIALKNATDDIMTIFSEIISSQLPDAAGESLRINANIMLLFSCFADELKGKTYSQSYKKILPAIEYIRKNYKHKIYIKTLEKQCNLSASQIRRIFQKELNLSPIEYKNKLLIKSACNMLKHDNTVSETSEALGFENIYAFSQFFKKQMGVSPKNYMFTVQ